MNIRNNAKAFILNENNEILLQKFEFTFTGELKILWVTPGGGVEAGEIFEPKAHILKVLEKILQIIFSQTICSNRTIWI